MQGRRALGQGADTGDEDGGFGWLIWVKSIGQRRRGGVGRIGTGRMDGWNGMSVGYNNGTKGVITVKHAGQEVTSSLYSIPHPPST